MIRALALWAVGLGLLLLVIVLWEDRLSAKGRIPLGRLRRLWLRVERRRAPRYRVNWAVRYQRLEAGRPAGVQTRDVSRTGAGLTLEEKVPVGSMLELEVTLPNQAAPIQVTGEVMWVKEVAVADEGSDGRRRFFIGLHFHNLKPGLEQIFAATLGSSP